MSIEKVTLLENCRLKVEDEALAYIKAHVFAQVKAKIH